jgi:fibronectin type 3 domain-containing protein
MIAAIANCTTISLQWDPNTETDLAGYAVYRSYTTSGLKRVATLPKVTTYTFINQTGGRRYYYAVTASNTAGQESSAPKGVHLTVDSLTIGGMP